MVLQRLHGVAVEVAGGLPTWRLTSADAAPWTLTLEPGAPVPHNIERDWRHMAMTWEVEGELPDPQRIRMEYIDPDDGATSTLVADPRERTMHLRWTVDEPESPERNAQVLGVRLMPLLARLDRPCLALHAAAAVTEGGAVVVCGESGAGKSTLVAGLVSGGARAHGEEPVVVDLGAEGAFAWAGTSHLKLEEGSPGATALRALGWKARPSWEKVDFNPPSVEPSDSAVPVVAVCVVEGTSAVERLAPEVALPTLIAHRYPIHGFGLRVDFPLVAALVGAVPVWRLPVAHGGTLARRAAEVLALV